MPVVRPVRTFENVVTELPVAVTGLAATVITPVARVGEVLYWKLSFAVRLFALTEPLRVAPVNPIPDAAMVNCVG